MARCVADRHLRGHRERRKREGDTGKHHSFAANPHRFAPDPCGFAPNLYSFTANLYRFAEHPHRFPTEIRHFFTKMGIFTTSHTQMNKTKAIIDFNGYSGAGLNGAVTRFKSPALLWLGG